MKSIYRIARNGARIIITTPNVYRLDNISRIREALDYGFGFGPSPQHILHDGSGAHHWKEFSVFELYSYITRLSPDFLVSRALLSNFDGSEEVDLTAFCRYLPNSDSAFQPGRTKAFPAGPR